MKRVVALVTGSNRGIGASCIEEFARQGVTVVINYCHHEEEAKALEEEIKSRYKVDVMTIKCDISKEEEVENMVNEIVDRFGGIDILVNNASVCRDSLFMDKNIKEFKRILDVNLIGTYLCSKYVGKVMLEAKNTTILLISSGSANLLNNIFFFSSLICSILKSLFIPVFTHPGHTQFTLINGANSLAKL